MLTCHSMYRSITSTSAANAELSSYEKRRLDSIARNKRKIEEIFGKSEADTKMRKKSRVCNQYLHNSYIT